MNLFGKRHAEPPALAERLAQIEAELSRVSSALRQLESEQILMHDQVRKWMRRAVAAERAAERTAEQPDRVVSPETPLQTRRAMWGPRARRLARSAPQVEENGGTDGLHP